MMIDKQCLSRHWCSNGRTSIELSSCLTKWCVTMRYHKASKLRHRVINHPITLQFGRFLFTEMPIISGLSENSKHSSQACRASRDLMVKHFNPLPAIDTVSNMLCHTWHSHWVVLHQMLQFRGRERSFPHESHIWLDVSFDASIKFREKLPLTQSYHMMLYGITCNPWYISNFLTTGKIVI